MTLWHSVVYQQLESLVCRMQVKSHRTGQDRKFGSSLFPSRHNKWYIMLPHITRVTLYYCSIYCELFLAVAVANICLLTKTAKHTMQLVSLQLGPRECLVLIAYSKQWNLDQQTFGWAFKKTTTNAMQVLRFGAWTENMTEEPNQSICGNQQKRLNTKKVVWTFMVELLHFIAS